MYYNLGDIRRVGRLYLIAAPLALIAAIVTTLLAQPDPQTPGALTASMIMTLLIFGVGYYFLQIFTGAFAYKQVVEKSTLIRLADTPPTPRPFGMNVRNFEAFLVAFALLVAVVLSISLPPAQGISGGGIAVGWLGSTGLARLRFARKVAQEEKEQQRTFFFSDMNFGVRTKIGYIPLGIEPEPVADPTTVVRKVYADGKIDSVPQTQLQRRAAADARARAAASTKKRSTSRR